MKTWQGYEMVIGLEVHAELSTASKIFCGCSTAFGAQPNTQCCPVCTGMPGTLPVLNHQVLEYAIMAGLATNCRIARYSKFDRKNYFYPDLPKAYQISQYDLPICQDGYLDIETEEGQKRIGITRIHMEEDAGKLVHLEGQGTLVDCNRCGVPLIEIVSEPHLSSGEEAKAYLQKLRAVLLYTGVSDCRMNEGSLRCDVNLSVRKIGDDQLGTRTEMKNLNSFQSVVRAIDYEFQRQVKALQAGEEIIQETRRFDAQSGKTSSLRSKENADDYRYFPEPDLPPIEVTDEMLSSLKERIPELPDTRKARYISEFSLSPYIAEQITLRRERADYFEQAAAGCAYPKLAANLILSEVLRLLPDEEAPILLPAASLGELAQLLGEGSINSSTGRRVLEALWGKEDISPRAYVEKEGLFQIRSREELLPVVREVLAEQPKSVASYRKGKTSALQALLGQAMRKTSGRGDPVMIEKLLIELLNAEA